VCLTERLFEAARERVAAVALGIDRLLEDRLAACGLFGEDPLRLTELGLRAALRLVMRDHPAQIEIDHDRRLAAGTDDFELGLQACHDLHPSAGRGDRPSRRHALS
jgi:hypothetical protein